MGRILGLVAAVASVLFGAPSALAAHPTPATPGEPVPDAVADALGGKVSVTEDGLYRVESKSAGTFTTHGPDYVGSHLEIGAAERPPVCVDDPSEPHTEFLYAYQTTQPNNIETEGAHIQQVVRRMNWLIHAEALASDGPHADLIVRCTDAGEIKVSAYPVGARADGSSAFASVIAAAKSAGFTNERVDYSILLDAPLERGIGGVAFLSQDDRLEPDNKNNNPPGFGPGYAVTRKSLWDTYVPLHELGHSQGAVQDTAPGHAAFNIGHTFGGGDVLSYEGPGTCSGLHPGEDTFHFDCRWDTYFDAAPEPGEWLESHWNLGSPLNRFIEFTRFRTELDARPMLIDNSPMPLTGVPLGRLRAELVNLETGEPLAGKEIVFRTFGGSELCRAETDPTGTASCHLRVNRALRAVLGLRYTAEFAGDVTYAPAEASGKLVRLLNLLELL